MFKCNYCGRYLKKKYEKCPGCGSKSFEKLQNYQEKIIKTPPKGGYVVNLENYKLKKKEHKAPLFLGIYILIMVFIFSGIYIILPASFVDFSDFNIFSFIFMLIGAAFLIVGIKNAEVFFSKAKVLLDDSNEFIRTKDQ